MQQEINSILLDNAVNALAQLPGIGKKTALRLALHILRRDESEGIAIGQSLPCAVASGIAGYATIYLTMKCAGYVLMKPVTALRFVWSSLSRM